MTIPPVLPMIWMALGLTILVASLFASRSVRAFLVGIGAVSVLWIVPGAIANLVWVLTGANYSGFADTGISPFITQTWQQLVVPHAGFFIGLLIVFQVTAGVLVLIPGRPRRLALWLLMAFNLALISFGWAYLAWIAVLVPALALLLRADRRLTFGGLYQPIDNPSRSAQVS